MRAILTDIANVLNNIRRLFAGVYVTNESDFMQHFKRDFYNIDNIPTCQQDSMNLKNDRRKAVKEYQKAFKQKLSESI